MLGVKLSAPPANSGSNSPADSVVTVLFESVGHILCTQESLRSCTVMDFLIQGVHGTFNCRDTG